jgi:O-acetyl-ADP-ribose deacetylase (regulator of RNase III)
MENGEADLLVSCYQRSLTLAATNDIRSIAFPCISTGVYGYPVELATSVAINTVKDFLEKNVDHFQEIIFCCFSKNDLMIYENFLKIDNRTYAVY